MILHPGECWNNWGSISFFRSNWGYFPFVHLKNWTIFQGKEHWVILFYFWKESGRLARDPRRFLDSNQTPTSNFWSMLSKCTYLPFLRWYSCLLKFRKQCYLTKWWKIGYDKNDQIHEFKTLINLWEQACACKKANKHSELELYSGKCPEHNCFELSLACSRNWWLNVWGDQHDLTLRYKINSQLFSSLGFPFSLTLQFLEEEQEKTTIFSIIICTFRSLPLPFPTPE